MRPRGEGKLLSKNPPVPDGLASQPTPSRLVRTLSSEENRHVRRAALLECAARRIRGTGGGHRHRYLTIDIYSPPIEMHDHQPNSAHNGHYHMRIFHPLIWPARDSPSSSNHDAPAAIGGVALVCPNRAPTQLAGPTCPPCESPIRTITRSWHPSAGRPRAETSGRPVSRRSQTLVRPASSASPRSVHLARGPVTSSRGLSEQGRLQQRSGGNLQRRESELRAPCRSRPYCALSR
jgi:hypothetical protein